MEYYYSNLNNENKDITEMINVNLKIGEIFETYIPFLKFYIGYYTNYESIEKKN
jgi:hypothetical protein